MYWWYWCLRSNTSFRHPTYPQVILKIQRGEKMPSILHFVICTLRTRWRQLFADNSFTEDTSSLSCILELFQSTLISRRCRPERRRTWSERWAGGVLLQTPALCSTFRYNFFMSQFLSIALSLWKPVFSPETALNLASPGDWTGNSNWHPIEPDEAAVIWLLRNT